MGDGINYELLEKMFRDEKYCELIDIVVPLLETELEEESRFKLEELLGRTYFCKSDYSQSIEYNLYALNRAKNFDQLADYARANFNLAPAFSRIGDSAKSIYYAKKALQLYGQLGDEEKVAYAHNTLAVTYLERHKFKKAEYHLKKSLEGSAYMPPQHVLAISLNLASVHINEEDYQLAIDRLETYLPDILQTNNMRLQSNTYKDLAKAYEYASRYDEATSMLQKALEIQSHIEDKFEQSECYAQLSSLAEKQEDYKQAFIYLKKYQALKNELMDKENHAKLEQLEKRVKTREKLTYIKQNKRLSQLNQELREANQKINRLAKYDPLTGVCNRRGFIEHIADNPPTGVIMIDVDNFKVINDTYGHQMGDHVLVFIANCLDNIVGTNGVVGRWGGEEFIIALTSEALEDAIALSEKIQTDLKQFSESDSNDYLKLTATIGISLDKNKSLKAHVSYADQLMYEGKRAGKNRIMY